MRAEPGTDPLPAGDGRAPLTPLLAQAPATRDPANPAPAATPAPENKTLPIAPLSEKPTPTENVTINLINRLVQRGVLTKEDAEELIRQAEQDAVSARIQAQADAGAAAARALAQRKAAPPADEDTVRVTYIPEFVKKQIRDDLRAEVMAQARGEGWTAPRQLPAWVPRFRLFGDIRVRYQADLYPRGNDNTGSFPNFNAINTGAPFDVTGNLFSPQFNVDQDRQRLRLRARLGTEVDLGENFTAGIRLGTGENNSPVTQNQTLGVANGGQGGNFSKLAVWIDRAFVKYEFGGETQRESSDAKGGPAAEGRRWDVTFLAGRFDNPFFSTSMIWADDLGFDGVALQARYQVREGIRLTFAGGAFPVFNTDLNFSSNRPAKFKSSDKWLYGAQLGAEVQLHKDFSAKIGVAYYHFDGIEGRLSSPFTPLTAADAGDTDNTRPSFAQRGNTYRALRDIVANVNNGFGTTNQFQYFGLATPFQEVALTARLDYSRFEPIQVSLTGEYVRNLAFAKGTINRFAVNNRTGLGGAFDGGSDAWNVAVRVGHAKLEKRWDWQASLGYRYVESDAVVDAFVDSDFGGGGTNLKGFTLNAAVALSARVSLAARWLSATSIGGPKFSNDTFQFELHAKF
ncbi:MAG: putative porin [Verrucomicrobia bacterium]|nr:putative porin [Verrucomicrobiota bacterium]